MLLDFEYINRKANTIAKHDKTGGELMQDTAMTELLYNRDEKGLAALKSKHYKIMMKIALGSLSSPEDAEACVNDPLLPHAQCP